MIIDRCRNKKELLNLYKSRPMPNQYDFDWLINNPNLFCFYHEQEGYLQGFITVQRENGLLTLSGTAVRRIMPDAINAIIKVCNAFDEDMYAFTPLRHAALLLKKAGFKHIKNDKYMRLKNG